MRELSPKQMKFVTAYIECGVASDAARAAGYSASTSRRAAQKLMKNPKVKAAIDAGRERLRKEGEYDLEKAVADLDRYIAGAIAKNQYNAVAKLNETKLKILGILDERPTWGVIDLTQVIAAARSRALPASEQPPMIDVTPAEPTAMVPVHSDIFGD